MTTERSWDPPPPFRGGILADAMGLGKTLTVIALIAVGLHSSASRHSGQLPGPTSDGELETLKTTLVILPLSRGSPISLLSACGLLLIYV